MLKYFIFTGIIFFLSLTILYITITNIDPLGSQRLIGLVLFFVSLFLGITSFFTFLFFFAKEVFSKKYLGLKSFHSSLRRGVLVGFFITIIGVLQFLKILDIYETILLTLFFILVEYIFSTHKKQL